MSKKPPSKRKFPSLTTSKETAVKEIKKQIAKGRDLNRLELRSIADVNSAGISFHKWVTYNKEMLARFFDSPTYSKQFRDYCYQDFDDNMTWRESGHAIIKGAGLGYLFLETVLERLKLIPEANLTHERRGAGEAGNDVFVVHGHDNAAKEAVARHLEKLKFHAIILHEQPNLNKTIIEKLEGHSDVQFAVVILTPDDVGYPLSDSRLAKTRARQNVIFELGFFIGKLGRDKVCALYKGDIELPSDYSGVTYIPLDHANAWKLELAREMKAAGLHVDLNAVY